MSGKPVPFVGFEEPKYEIDSNTWKDRVIALANSHPGEWAKYGPFANNKTANNVAAKVRSLGILGSNADSNQLLISTQVEKNTDSDVGYYLYIKVNRNGIPFEG